MAEFSSPKSQHHSVTLTFCIRPLLDSRDQNLLAWKYKQISAYKEKTIEKWAYLFLWVFRANI